MTDVDWIGAALAAARPQAIAALLRYFRDLDTAEEAFQEASLRTLKTWPRTGPPRDPAAWLIFVGRNVAFDSVRKHARQEPLPEEALISDLEDAEAGIAESIDQGHYSDDVLRLLFVCCHPDLPATQQIALALRVVSGLSVKQIARAFLVGEAAMEQRITRGQAPHRRGRRSLRGAGRGGARNTARGRRGDDLPRVQRGLFGERRRGFCPRPFVRGGDPARTAFSTPLPPPSRRSWDCSRCSCCSTRARLRASMRTARSCCSMTKTAARWDRTKIAEGPRAHRQGHAPSPPRALPDPGGNRRPARARRKARGYRLGADRSPLRGAGGAAAVSRRHAQPRGRRLQGARTRGGASDGRAAGEPPRRLFPFITGCAARCCRHSDADREARDAFSRAIALANSPAEAAHIRMHLDRLMQESDATTADKAAK